MQRNPSAPPSSLSKPGPRVLTKNAARLAISLAVFAAMGVSSARAGDKPEASPDRADRGHGARSTLQPASPTPAVGATGVVIADANLTRPAVTPCVVPLYDGLSFIGFDPQAFDYTPPAGCKGPYAKVVLEADFSVNAGRQFDRTASLAIGGVNLYFGTTQEPSAAVAPSWRIERDITEYASLLSTPQKGRIDLDNVVDDTYTGILRGSGRILFYPATRATGAAPGVADAVVSLNPTGRPVFLTAGTDKLLRNVTLPKDVTQAFLDVYTESQSKDEFWWTCAPTPLAESLQTCGGGTFREAWVTIDGQPAGVAPVYPWIYTGGIDPGAWRPTVGIQTLNFMPYRVDLTPFASLLSNGKAHDVAVQVAGSNSGFAVAANLLVYRDPKGRATTGGLIENTLASQQPGGEVSSNTITTANGTTTGGVSMTAGRHFAISGYVDTPKGRVVTRVAQRLSFSNQQTYDVSAAKTVQTIDQLTTLQSETTTSSEKRKSWGRDDHRSDSDDRDDDRGHGPRRGEQLVTRQSLRYPVTLNYVYDSAALLQTATITQGLERKTELGDGRRPVFRSSLKNALSTTSGLKFNEQGQAIARVGQSGKQAVRYTDSLGSCFDRGITTTSGALTTVVDASDCPQGNLIDWRALPDGAPEQGVFEWVSR